MKTYTFLIGTTDDFESMDEMLEHFEGSDYPDSICTAHLTSSRRLRIVMRKQSP